MNEPPHSPQQTVNEENKKTLIKMNFILYLQPSSSVEFWRLNSAAGGRAGAMAPPLSASRIAELQAEYFAEDVEVPPAAAAEWSEDRLIAFLENGGVEPAAPQPLGRLARVACLHGTAGNEKILRMQVAKLISELKDEMVFDVYEGSSMILPGNPHGDLMHRYFGQKEILREYAPAMADAEGRRIYEPEATEEALLDLESRIASAGGCDVLLGFSQGANFSTLLAARAAARVGPLSSLRCLILLAPSRPGWVSQAKWRDLFCAPLGIPCLIIGGEKDEAAGSGPEEVSKLFHGSLCIKHAEGHRPLPADRQDAEQIVQRIRTFLRERCPA